MDARHSSKQILILMTTHVAGTNITPGGLGMERLKSLPKITELLRGDQQWPGGVPFPATQEGL